MANAFRELEDSRATMPLVEALGDECEHVRRAAAQALNWAGDARARNALIGVLRSESDSVRFWAALGLGGWVIGPLWSSSLRLYLTPTAA